MFEASPRKHPVQTFQFWFIVLCSFLVVSAWKLDFFASTSPKEVTSTRVFEEVMPPAPVDHLNVGKTGGRNDSAVTLSQMLEVENTLPEDSMNQATMESDAVILTSHETTSTQIKPSEQTSASTLKNVRDNDAEAQQPVVQTAYARNSTQKLDSLKSSSGADTASVLHANSSASTHTITPSAAPTSQSLSPADDPTPGLDLGRADRLIQRGDDVAALRLCSEWYWTKPKERHLFIDRLNLVADKVYAQPQPHYLEPYVFKFNDKIEDIAAKHNLTREYLVRLNRIDPKQIKTGQVLKVLNGPFSIVIDISDLDLTVHAHGYYVARMPIGVGEKVSLKPDTYRVGEKIRNPAYVTDVVNLASGDPKNPLGTRLLTLVNAQGQNSDLAIHGTNAPGLIGQIAEEGSIKILNRDVEQLFDLIAVGAEVTIKN